MIEQMVNVQDLVEAIDQSADDFVNGNFKVLLAEKYDDSYPGFKTSIKRYGIRVPILCAHFGNELGLDNGHHRLAVAFYEGIEEIPVIFAEGAGGVWSHDVDWDITRSPRYINSQGTRDEG